MVKATGFAGSWNCNGICISLYSFVHIDIYSAQLCLQVNSHLKSWVCHLWKTDLSVHYQLWKILNFLHGQFQFILFYPYLLEFFWQFIWKNLQEIGWDNGNKIPRKNLRISNSFELFTRFFFLILNSEFSNRPEWVLKIRSRKKILTNKWFF